MTLSKSRSLETRSLVDEQGECDEAELVVDVAPGRDVARPRLTDHIDEHAVGGGVELNHDEGGAVPLLVEEGEEVAREPLGGVVRDVAYVLVVQLVLQQQPTGTEATTNWY